MSFQQNNLAVLNKKFQQKVVKLRKTTPDGIVFIDKEFTISHWILRPCSRKKKPMITCLVEYPDGDIISLVGPSSVCKLELKPFYDYCTWNGFDHLTYGNQKLNKIFTCRIREGKDELKEDDFASSPHDDSQDNSPNVDSQDEVESMDISSDAEEKQASQTSVNLSSSNETQGYVEIQEPWIANLNESTICVPIMNEQAFEFSCFETKASKERRKHDSPLYDQYFLPG